MLGRIKNRFRTGSNDNSLDSTSSRARVSSPAGYENNLDFHAKLTDLASFDACVEACDALAANSSYANAHVDKETGMADCSVIVSPDGDLLLIPQIVEEQAAVEPMHMLSNGSGNGNSSLSKPDIDYDSSIVMGNDLKTARELNGFSAMGWSAAATSLAIRQTESSLRNTETFLSQLHQASVDSQKQHLVACRKLRHDARIGEYPNTSQTFPPTPMPKELRKNTRTKPPEVDLNSLSDLEPMGSSWNNGNGSRENLLEIAPHRVGPLVYSGASMYAAMIALEQYYLQIPVPKPTVQQNLVERADQTAERAYHREKALKEMQRKTNESEQRLAHSKLLAHKRWLMVHQAEEMVTRIVEERMLVRSRARERQRMEALEAENANHEKHAVAFATSAEIWDIVAAATANMENGDFTPIDFPTAPMAGVMDQSSERSNGSHSNGHGGAPDDFPPRASTVVIPMASRAEIEHECSLPALRAAAMAADEAVEDAAQTLLNCLSILDTTRRSARVAAETSLLSACNAQAESLQRTVLMERAAIEARLVRLEQLEKVTAQINVREDLNLYIMADKKERGGSTWMGDYDDGGIASALAILSSHVEGSTGMGPGSPVYQQQTWSEELDEATSPEMLEDAINELFETELNGDVDKLESFEKTVKLLCRVASEPNTARSKRSTICYALNSKRSAAEISSQQNFDALCQVFDAILSGCDHEAGGVANAKMCMMLSQTFYIDGDSEDTKEESSTSEPASPSAAPRSKRIYVKSTLICHHLWGDDEFWDQALHQCVTESLTHSGVMQNFDRSPHRSVKKSEWTEAKKLRWHDLTHAERSEAASQVHAVVFAQLGALAHSMMEFGCGMERSCAFVRRMSVRNQLPISQRTMLLQHLVGNKNDTTNNN